MTTKGFKTRSCALESRAHAGVEPVSREISRRSFVQTGLAAAGLAGAPAILRGAGRKRNVLFIQSDDLCNRLGCYGYPVKSPNIDRLAQSGVRFDRAYCQYSLCGPSRASVMTGLAPDTTRVWDLQTSIRQTIPNVVTMPQAFKANGYFAGRSGKIYHYNNPSEIGTPGFDDPASWDETHNPAGADRMNDEALVTWIVQPAARGAGASRDGTGAGAPGGAPARAGTAGQTGASARGQGRSGSGVRISQDGVTPILPLSQNGDLGVAMAYHRSTFPDQHQTDYLVADEAIDMMEKHRSDPWFIGAGFFKPHVPWIVPSKYFDMYRLEDMDVPRLDPNEKSGAPNRPRRVQVLTDEQHREAIRAYYASTSFMDAQVGRLLDALKRLGVVENTVVVFWGDNGFQLGEHGLWQKNTLFEPSARVPLIWAGAGTRSVGKGCGRTVESLDIYPTLVGLCDLRKAPANLQGRSLVPLLVNPAAAWDHPAITQMSHGKTGGYSMRTERYRYTLWMDATGGEELYDYEADPTEERNLADDSAVADVKAKLRARLEQIVRSRGVE